MPALVRVRLLLDKAVLGTPTRVFPDDTTVEDVLKKSLEPFPDCTVVALEVCPTKEEKHADRSQFPQDQFDMLSVEAIREFGLFWIAHLTRENVDSPASSMGATSKSGGSASRGPASGGLPNSLEPMMQRERGVHVTWPPHKIGATFDVRIYNALIDDLKAEGLGWHHADAGPEASGPMLLNALSRALHFALPFDLKGALVRRAMHIPERFKADALKVRGTDHTLAHAFSHTFPPSHLTSPPQVTPAEAKKKAVMEEKFDQKLRLETHKLLDHAAAIASACDTARHARWGRSDEFQGAERTRRPLRQGERGA